MYDQGGYNSQLGQSTRNPMPPPYQQHLPVPSPPPHFQQGRPDPPTYQHGSPAQPYQFRQVPPVGMSNSLPFHGTGPLPPIYIAAQHHSGHLTPLRPHTVNRNPVGIPPPRTVPQPQSGQTLYRAAVHPPSQQSGPQNILIHPSPNSGPPPPPSSYFSSAPLGTTVHSTSQNPVPSIAPLPPANPPSSLAPVTSLSPSSMPIPSLSSPSHEGKSETLLRAFGKELSAQPHDSVVVATAYSPSDSDTEMEDDITQVDNKGVSHSFEDVKPEYAPIHNELDVKHQNAPQCVAECKLEEVRSYEKAKVVSFSGSGVYSNDRVKSEHSPPNVHDSPTNSAGNRSDPAGTNFEKSTAAPAEETGLPRGSTANDGWDSELCSAQHTKGGIPFRLVADYASDDNLENDAEGHPENTDRVAMPPSTASGSDHSIVTGFILDKLEGTNNLFGKGLEMHSGSGLSCKAPSSVEIEGVITISATYRDDVDNKHERHSYRNNASVDALQNEGAHVDVGYSGKFSKEHKEVGKNGKVSSDQPKVDEFGRLAREADSDTDSDDSRYARKNRRRRRNRSRSRSHSHSLSPTHRWRRRSPRLQRRRQKRGQSHSLSPRNRRSRSQSPRNQRSRSRSPRYRHTSDFGGESKRWVKKQIPECFDFRRGRCYRGASCRFLHDDSNRNEDSRRKRFEKPHSLVSHGSRNSIDKKIKHVSNEVSVHGAVEVDSPEMQAHSRLSNKREDSHGVALQSVGEPLDYHIPNSNVETPPYGTQTGDQKLLGPIALSNESHQEMKDFPSKSENSSISDSSPHKTSASAPNSQLASVAYPNSTAFQQHPSKLLSSALSHLKDVDGPQIAQPQFAPSSFHSSAEVFRPSMLVNQQSYFPMQPNSSLTSMLPAAPLQLPDSTVNTVTATSSTPSQFQQCHLHVRNDFGSQVISSSYPNQLPTNSQVGGFQQIGHPPTVDRNLPPMHVLPMYSMPSQQFGGADPSGDGCLRQASTQSFMALNSYAQSSVHTHTMPFLQELQTSRNQAFSGGSMLPVGFSNSSSYPYTQQQQPPHIVQHSLTDITCNLEKTGSSLRSQPDFTDPNKPCVGSATSTYQNPYSSAIRQPTAGMFSSDALRVEKDATYCSFHTAADQQSIMSQLATSLSNSTKAVGQNFPDSNANQYDPLVDSIEESAKTSRKHGNVRKWEASGDSDGILRLDGSNKQLNVEENRTKEVETVASATSVDNEEYDEDADAEVGAIESLSNSIGLANAAVGETGIDQAKSPGKSKKNKDSRSMKLFKVVLADFVKEVLKPSWRQGNMSKEAFKTIVKKTVDKASGAMKGHRIPKSREKMNQYIDSSRRKLTKLVMGYVDKYVKV